MNVNGWNADCGWKWKMSKYTEDKERIDKITELIANQEPVKEWVCIYWMAVAIGHILEWVVKHNEKHTC